MIERDYDISFIADLAFREKQIQQIYRPIIAVHKWFARRPGTLFRAILLSEFAQKPLKECFYEGNKFNNIRIADPFMGGGTPLIEANRLGCGIIGFDINPMAYWIVKQEIDYINLDSYKKVAYDLRSKLNQKIGHLYKTKCLVCGSNEADAKYFLWVKLRTCSRCGREFSLFPGYLIAENKRHPRNVVICSSCGELNETDSRIDAGNCCSCGEKLSVQGSAKRSHSVCPYCGQDNKFPDKDQGVPRHRMFAIEYYCPVCKSLHKGRFFKRPDLEDIARFKEAKNLCCKNKLGLIPNEEIPAGDETDRLHNWGYRYYRDMFNARQLLGLELSCRLITQEQDQRIKSALATNLSDLLRYQNMLCRYDTMALKSLDIFSIHGFPVGLIQCESNLLGIPNGKDSNVGSGGWLNIIDKYIKAKSYCNFPFEVQSIGKKKRQITTYGEWIGEISDTYPYEKRDIELHCGNAIDANLAPSSLDAVLTDPPYYGNVQYAELMDFCYVWLKQLVNDIDPAFIKQSTRNVEELTINANMGRGIDHFTEGLSAIFQHMAKALKPGSPLAFTYHHNTIEAYLPIATAILDSNLICSASLPCPGEMGASIHIKGTKSSIIDTLFICRSDGSIPEEAITRSPEVIAEFVKDDISKLESSKIKVTIGDKRCMIYGHLIRLAIRFLSKSWNKDNNVGQRRKLISSWIDELGGPAYVEKYLEYE